MSDTAAHKVDIGDAELHVEITESVSGSGPDLLLVAGLGGRGAFWSNQIAAFAQHFRVITFDHRGCGSSTAGLLTHSTAHLARDVIALMDALEISSAHLVGHSTGGAIGQHIALGHADRLAKLVLSCSWPGPDAYFTELFRNRRAVLEQCGPLDYLTMGTYLAMPSSVLQPQMRDAQETMAQRLAAFPGLEVELSRIAAVVAHDLRARLPEISAPTLCIGAMDDQLTPPGFTQEMADLIPGAEVRLLERGGHFSPIAATDVYNRHVLEFLTS